jgi:phospholipid/cholesterol/gamma-HCH transport system ATP-binding protein
MSPPIIEFGDVSLSFGPKKVLDGFNLQIAPQERMVILGPSGVGKSTLLRLIVGILLPDHGSVRVDGLEVSTLPERALNKLRAKIGMVYQYAALISSLTVEENLALPLREMTRLGPGEIARIVEDNLALVGMETSKSLLPAELSGGMKKRIGIARALVMKPKIILFDEPSTGLDPVNSSVIDKLILDLGTQAKVTCVIVTHEIRSAFRIATRMAMLHQGRNIAEGTPKEMKHSDNPVVSQFLAGETNGPLHQEHAISAS